MSSRRMHPTLSTPDRVQSESSIALLLDEHSSLKGVDILEHRTLTPAHGVISRIPRFMNSDLTDSFTHRISRPLTVLPRPSLNNSIPTHSAIPAQDYTRNITNSQDVSSFVNNSAPYLSSSVTRSEAYAHYLGPSVPSPSSQNVLNNRRQRLRTSNQVFTSSHGVIPHGLPQNLPPAPSTLPRRVQPDPEPKFSHSTFPDFASMSSNYLNMLAHKSDNTMSANISDNATVPFKDFDSFDVAGELMGIVDVIHGEYLVSSDSDEQGTEHSPASATTIPPTPETPELWTSPDFATLGDEFLNTSPFSPDVDNLHTPLIGNDDMLTGMLDPAVTGDLFAPMDWVDYEYEKPPVPTTPTPLPENLYTMTPESPALHDFSLSIDPSAVYSKPSFPHPTQSTASVSRNTLGLEGATSKVPESVVIPNRRRTSATGTRKGVTPDALVSVDAPTQPRKYATPSVTSRKEVPSVFAKKRSRSTAFGDEDDDYTEPPLPPDATEKEMIEFKRRQNTVAARRSRKRKLQYQQDLEDKVERLTRERDVWKTRAQMCQDMLVTNGVQFAPFQDSIDD